MGEPPQLINVFQCSYNRYGAERTLVICAVEAAG